MPDAYVPDAYTSVDEQRLWDTLRIWADNPYYTDEQILDLVASMLVTLHANPNTPELAR